MMADEGGSLTILANVALCRPHFTHPVVYPRLRTPRTRKLAIININGNYVAAVNELMSLPFTSLLRIFIDSSEDSPSQADIFVCNFGSPQNCGVKFTALKNSNNLRLVHMIKCHLVQHLVITKPGSLVKISHKSMDYLRTADLLGSVIEMKSTIENMCDSSVNRTTLLSNDSKKLESKVPSLHEISNSSNDISILNEFSKIDVHEHSYASSEEKNSAESVTPSENCLAKESDDIAICDDECSVNCERSEELTSFMMSEVLHAPANIYVIDGERLIVEELPIVGSEVEVETSYDGNSENVTPAKGKSVWSCYFCPLTYVTKKSLNQHIRKKHSDCEETKMKRKISWNENTALTSECKVSKRMRLPSPDDFNNNDLDFELKENLKMQTDLEKQCNPSILKNALTKNPSIQRPIVNISNVWNNIHVQYV